MEHISDFHFLMKKLKNTYPIGMGTLSNLAQTMELVRVIRSILSFLRAGEGFWSRRIDQLSEMCEEQEKINSKF
jgi:hypothetical protein